MITNIEDICPPCRKKKIKSIGKTVEQWMLDTKKNNHEDRYFNKLLYDILCDVDACEKCLHLIGSRL